VPTSKDSPAADSGDTGAPNDPGAPGDPGAPEAFVAATPGLTEVAVYSSATIGPDQPPPLPHRRAVWSLVVLALTAFIFSTNESSVVGVISIVAKDMNRSTAAIGLLTTIFGLVNMLASIPFALMLRRLPRRNVLAATAAGLAVGTALFATAHNFAWLLAGRGMTALAGAAFWAIVTPTVAGMFSSANRGKSVSRLLLGASGAGIIGLPLVTLLAQHTGWRAPYWVLTALAATLAITIFTVMPSFRAEQGTAARGLVPSWPIFARILVVCGLTVGSIAVMWTFITPFATDVAGFSPGAVPTLLFIGGVSGVVSMFFVGRFLDRYPVRSVAIGLALLTAVWGTMALLGSVQPIFVICVVVQGSAWSILLASMVNWAIRHAPGSTDTANGTYATVFSGGNATGSIVGAALIAVAGAAWLPVASLVLTAAAAVLVWTMRGRYKRYA